MTETLKDIAEYQSDHDLLVVLNERVAKLTLAVEKKADDHEGRLRELEADVEGIKSTSQVWRYVLGIVLPMIVAAMGWQFIQFYSLNSTLDKRISTTIISALSDYSLIKTPR